MSSTILICMLALLTFVSNAQNTGDNCPPVHLFGARGTGEPPGYGFITGGFVNETLKAIPGATAEAIDYPADGSLNPINEVYKQSVQAGVENLTKQVTEFAQHCPQTPLVLVGYSQGGKIMDDALCGGGDPLMGINSTDATIAQFNIKAALLPGDDRFTVGEPFHVGNATHSGFDPRPSSQLRCGNYTDAIQLYCNANDEYCASGTSLVVHLSYYPQYGPAGLSFIESRLMSNTSTSSSQTSSTTSMAPTATPSSAAQGRLHAVPRVILWMTPCLVVGQMLSSALQG